MKPLVELSYTPNPLVADKCESTAFHYKGCNTPPTDLAAYGQYVNDFVATLVGYFGQEEVSTWRFEVSLRIVIRVWRTRT